MLYLVATPIGNLADLSYRAVTILQECQAILCEDTRHSAILLKHYSISTKLISLHKFNEAEREDAIITRLQANENIALISDAGMPGLCDPGERLIQRCVEEGIPFTVIPGASAPLMGLILSGFTPFFPFQFVGFIPRAKQEREQTILQWIGYKGNTVAFESAQRVAETLQDLARLAPNCRIAVTRELTKLHEEVLRGTAQELFNKFAAKPPRGELVLILASDPSVAQRERWMDLSPEEHVRFLEETYQISKKEAIKMAAEQRGIPKRTLYQALI